MTPVFQTNTRIPGGNCLQACIASVLDIPLAEAPHVVTEESATNWLEKLAAWLLPLGLSPVFVSPLNPCNAIVLGYCILGVQTDPPASRDFPEWLHAVVGRATAKEAGLWFEVIHDPNPRPRKIVEIKDVLFIVRNAAKG